MSNYNFISYSSFDALEFAFKLYDSLLAGPPSIPVWLDKREIKIGQDWDKSIVEAIHICESLIFVMTHDSVEDKSVCKREWIRALRYKKAIVPLLLHPDAVPPFQLEGRQYIDFTGDFDIGLAQLRLHLRWRTSPKGVLQSLKDRFEDYNHDLRRPQDLDQETRIQNEIALLKNQIVDQQRIIDDSEGAAKRVEENIIRGIEWEHQPERPVSGVTHTKFINHPPAIAPTYFQDRHDETNLIGDFLHNDAQCLMTIVGRAGIGKTAMVCRLLKSLEGGQLPDNGKEMHIDGIVYLSMTGTRKVTVPNLYADLSRLLPDDVAQRLGQVYRDAKTSIGSKMQALLEAFPLGKVILLLDNFETLINPATRSITSGELDEALTALLNLPPYAVKVILTTQIAPRDMALIHPERQFHINLDRGLELTYAKNILREMDADGTVGLKNAPAELLDEAWERTRGNPRALEALYAFLSADLDTSLKGILKDQELLPENVMEVLVGEAFNCLDATARMVMEGVAIYGRPVTPSAVDYLLQLHLPGVDSAPVLSRLVNMLLVLKEAERYFMHPVDREYVLSRVPEGDASDRDEPVFTQFSLLHRGADYFKEARMPRENWKTIDDLSAQLVEFELRCAGREYDIAAEVLSEIDFNYLLLWGHFRLIIELHERLQGKLSDPGLKSASAGNLGRAYSSVGDYQMAIEYYEQALAIDRDIGKRKGEGNHLDKLGLAYRNLGQFGKAIEYHENALAIHKDIGDRRGEGADLGNIGLAYYQLGQVDKAIEYHEQALTIHRDIAYKRGEGADLGNIGLAYHQLGQVNKAIEYHKQALAIACKIRNRGGEGADLGNLGTAYKDLGQVDNAIEYYEQALTIAREIGYRYLEVCGLVCIGDTFSDTGELDNAVKRYKQAIEIADEIKNVQSQHEARYGLARAHLYSGNLETARSTAESARMCDYPTNNHNVLALLGVIALQQGDRTSANEAFKAAVAASDILLDHSDTNYEALDAKGLALCGLALCEGKSDYIEEAIHAYTKARSIIRAPGIMGRFLRLFDELARADTQGLLSGVREAAGGK